MIVIALQFLAALLMWCAFKPLGLWQLVFVAALCWIPVIATQWRLPRHSYKLIYFASALAWLALLQGIRLAYWPLYAGWFALSLYLAVYIPLFILVCRYLVHRWRWPLAAAAPLVWIGCELIRCYLLSGFGGCLLAHTLAEQPVLIQLASQIGPQGVSGLIVLCGVALFQGFAVLPEVDHFLRCDFDGERAFTNHPEKILKTDEPILTADVLTAAPLTDMIAGQEESEVMQASRSKRLGRAWVALVGSLVLLTGCYFASRWMFDAGQAAELDRAALMKVALIQEVAETRFEYNPERAQQSWARYAQLTSDVGKQQKDLDLIVWPESVFTPESPFVEWDGAELSRSHRIFASDPQTAYANLQLAVEMQSRLLEHMQQLGAGDDRGLYVQDSNQVKATSELKPPALLLGINLWQIHKDFFARFNAVVFQPNDATVSRDFYAKRNLVMFGEYIPFAEQYPEIYDSLGMGMLNVGDRWKTFLVNNSRIAPSICFEDMLPQVMQNQVATLISEKAAPDVLINVTNDGWFHGSSILDHHFACAVFAAVENRRPFLVSANTGISTWVSGNGVVKAKAAKMKAEAIVAEPVADGRSGLWQQVGDWPARMCGLLVLVVLAFCCNDRWQRLRRKKDANSTA